MKTLTELYHSLDDVEVKYDVEKIQVNGTAFWPYLRAHIYFHFMYQVLSTYENGDNANKVTALKKITRALAFYIPVFNLISVLIKPAKYFFFSFPEERKNYNGQVRDKLAESTVDMLGQKKSIMFISGNTNGIKHYATRNKYSYSTLSALYSIIGKIRKPSLVFNGESILVSVLSDLGISKDFNYKQKIQEVLLQATVCKWIFKIKKTKAIFVTDYGYFAPVYAANQLDIPSVEFQHGIIGKEHVAYNSKIDCKGSFFYPSQLMVFGERERDDFKTSHYIRSQNVHPVGNDYLEFIYNSKDNGFNFYGDFKRTVCIPFHFSEIAMASVIAEAAIQLKDHGFFFCPRMQKEIEMLSQLNLPENVFIVKDYSFQKVMSASDIYIGANSTCCLEALFFGKPIIFYDLEGRATYSFSRYLKPSEFVIYTNNANDLVQAITDVQINCENEIISFSDRFYKRDHKLHLKNALQQILN